MTSLSQVTQSFSFAQWVLDLAFPYIGSFHTASLGMVQMRGIQMFASDFSVRILGVCSGIYLTDQFFPGCTQW